jgi:hypothetical protein
LNTLTRDDYEKSKRPDKGDDPWWHYRWMQDSGTLESVYRGANYRQLFPVRIIINARTVFHAKPKRNRWQKIRSMVGDAGNRQI